MKALRSFHVPRAGGVAYAEGALRITGIGKWFFPPTPCRTVVRAESQDGAVGGASTDVESSLNLFEENTDGNKGGPNQNHGDGDAVLMRSFGGRVYMGTRHSFLDGTNGSRGDTLHHIESVGPISFVYDWQNSEHKDPETGRFVVEPAHVSTQLFGFIPIPVFLARVHQRMVVRDDANGWDLKVSIRALGSRINLITYEGEMKKEKKNWGTL